MTTFDYIKDLEYLLQDKIPNEKMKIILEKYTVFLENELKRGKTEDEIILSLGSPDEVAELFLTKQNEVSNSSDNANASASMVQESIKNEASLAPSNITNTIPSSQVDEKPNKKSNTKSKGMMSSAGKLFADIFKIVLGAFLSILVLPSCSIVLFMGVLGIVFASILSVALFSITVFLTTTSIICSILAILLIIFLSVGLMSLSLLIIAEFIKYFFIENRANKKKSTLAISENEKAGV